ncbi:MAG: hypothetical protein RL590_1374 [Actinomycetota bacterium]|jgi:chaperonin cofactor prefoldin
MRNKREIFSLALVLALFSGVVSPALAAQHQWGASYLDWSGALLSQESAVSQVIQPLELSDRMYWQVGWWWDGRNDGGYAGIQTKGFLADGRESNLAIFSLWNSTSAIPGPNSGCLPFGHEGIGHSCRIPIEMIAGNKYEIKIQMDLERGSKWWKATIQDLRKGTVEVIGAIEAPSINLKSTNWNNFIEYWGEAVACDSVGLASARFFVPFSSKAQVEFSSPRFSRPKDACVNSAGDTPSTGYIGDGVIRFGGPSQPPSSFLPSTLKSKALIEAESKAAAELKAKEEAEAKASLAKAQSELAGAIGALSDSQKVNRELQSQLNSVEAQFKLLSDSVSAIQSQVSQLKSKLAAALAGQNAANSKLKKICSARPKPKGC